MTPRSPSSIYDIFHYILSYLDPDTPYCQWDESDSDEEASPRDTLAQLAATHSTFSRPALALLWRSLPNDDALKHLLCAVGIAKEPLEGGDPWRSSDFCEAPETREIGWKRFQKYSSLVRTIVIDLNAPHSSPESSELSRDTFWGRVSSILGDTPVLPCLEAITFTSFNRCRAIDMGALGLLNSSVRDLCIRLVHIGLQEESKFRTAFSASLSASRNLEKLSVMVAPWSPVDLNSLPQSHPRLRHLKVDAEIKPDCLTSVATLPDLEHLSIRLWESVDIPLRFRRLQSLGIYSYGLDAICTLVHRLDAPQLCDFSIDSRHEHSGNLRADLSQCLNALIARRFTSLTAFNWICHQHAHRRYGYEGTRNPGASLAELIEPLLSLPTLRHLSLDFSGPIVPYSSADFCRMAEAWRDLETLSLVCESGWGPEDGPVQHGDLDCLVSFARNCPHLRTLRIPRVKIDPDAGTDIVTTTVHHLRDLNVDTILCPEEPWWDSDDPRSEEVLRDVVKRIFPFAADHLAL